jgi:copper chaperone CopZ
MSTNELSRQTLAVTGMTCSGCVRSVERVLARVPGVSSVTVDLARGRAVVEGTAEPARLVEAVTASGYGASVVGA